MTDKRWSWSSASGAARLALLLAGGLAGPAGAATVLEKRVEITVEPGGAVNERTHLEVRLDTERDLDTWSPYGIALDENRSLTSLQATVLRPDGKLVRVSRRDLDTGAASPDWVLHGSQQVRSVQFPPAPPGAVLTLDWETSTRPYFPSGGVALGERDAIERLTVVVRGPAAGAPLRWLLLAGDDGLATVALAEGVRITGALPAPEPTAHAPTESAVGPLLRYAWGPAGGWPGVGQWYEGVAASVPRDAGPVRARAQALISGIEEPRARLEALLAFARREVRYVAVEVGIGGYRPATPEETLARKWGDCKAKSFLLIDLLRAAGIAAYPAVILADPAGRVADFPSPDDFNHLIVAVAAEGVAAITDATAEGLLFVDPTHPYATAAWLPPAVQDQDALVVRGAASALVRTPTVASREVAELTLDLAVAADGSGRGRASLRLEGERAAGLEELMAVASPTEIDRATQGRLLAMVPAATVEGAAARCATSPAGTPACLITGDLSVAQMAAVSSRDVALALPGPETTPATSLLDGRTLPVVLRPGVTDFVLRLTLPAEWSAPAAEESQEDSPLGTFRQTVGSEGRTLTVTRRTELRRRIVEPADFPALRALALAERRAAKRRLRFQVAPPPAAAAPIR